MSTKHGPKGKGNGIQGKAATKGKRVAKAVPAPDAVVEETAGDAVADDAAGTEAEAPAGDDTPIDADAPIEDAAATTEPTAKRKRDMTIEDLQAEFRRVIGRDTQSRDRRYLLWRLSAGGLRRSPAGPIQKRAPRDKADMQVLPLGLLRETTRLLDAAVKASGVKNRSAFIRTALIEKLRAIGDPDADAAADALDAEAG
ncbi:MAG: hypothetical protein FJ087_15540 [Deltaproteobacteria bacterium]|nr:hypothetical protein [Deltaproteobacteria bacterium]